MFAGLVAFGRLIVGTLRDLAPIILVVAFFQLVVLRQPFPNLENVLLGLVLVMLGLALIAQGLEMALFPVGWDTRSAAGSNPYSRLPRVDMPLQPPEICFRVIQPMLGCKDRRPALSFGP